MPKRNMEYEAWILPWAGLGREITIGPVTIWPWNPARVQDTVVLERLKSWFARFVDHKGGKLATICLCSHGALDFRPLTEAEKTDVRDAVNCISFTDTYYNARASVEANNATIGPPSSDVFQLLPLHLRPDGHYVSILAGRSMDSGYTIDELFFQVPWAARGYASAYETPLIEGLSKLLVQRRFKSLRRRVMRSLEWFRLAHTEADNVSELSKVVMMGTAFEILLGFPKWRQTAAFRDRVIRLLKEIGLKTRTVRRVGTRNGKKRRMTIPHPAAWAVDFYNLRSKIVHGDEVDIEALEFKGWISHLIAADLVFGMCLILLLYERKCMGDEDRRAIRAISKILSRMQPNRNEAEDESAEVTPPVYEFERAFRTLGWMRSR